MNTNLLKRRTQVFIEHANAKLKLNKIKAIKVLIKSEINLWRSFNLQNIWYVHVHVHVHVHVYVFVFVYVIFKGGIAYLRREAEQVQSKVRRIATGTNVIKLFTTAI